MGTIPDLREAKVGHPPTRTLGPKVDGYIPVSEVAEKGVAVTSVEYETEETGVIMVTAENI